MPSSAGWSNLSQSHCATRAQLHQRGERREGSARVDVIIRNADRRLGNLACRSAAYRTKETINPV